MFSISCMPLRRYSTLVSRIITFSEAWIGFNEFPPFPNTNVDTNINVKNRTRRCALNLRGFSFAQYPILKFQGQGDTHRVKMKSKASGQTTDAVVAEWANCLWDTWTCHSLSNIEVCANASSNISKHQPAGKRLKKSTLAASTLACYVFICTNLEQASEYASNQPVYNGRNTSSGKALACWFFICTNLKQTLFKPQIYGAGPCQQVRQDFLKESSINFFFCARQL